jgi:hypothetical protein
MRPAGAQDATTVPSPEQLAQTQASLQQRVAALEVVPLAVELPGLTPSVSSNVPTAYGFSEGQGGVGIGYADKGPGNTRHTGALGVVLGLGDPYHGVGIDAGYNVLELFAHAGQPGPFDAGSFTFRAHRALGPNTQVAVGAENVADFGGGDNSHSYYAVLTQRFKLSPEPNRFLSRLYVTVGAGNGRFRVVDYNTSDKGKPVYGTFTGSSVRPIAAIGTNLGLQLSAFGEYNGDYVNVGLSIVPFKSLPIVVTPSINNIAHHDDPTTYYDLGVGYLFNY